MRLLLEKRERLQYTIENLPLYKKHNYVIHLPFERKKEIENNNDYYPNIEFVETDNKIYDKAVLIQESGRTKIMSTFDQLVEFNKLWGFKILPNYLILLTQYGTGGSYFSDTGVILQRLDKLSILNIDPAKTPIHEIVHIGVDYLVDQFNLNHNEKEGLVDGLCFSKLKNILPDYHIQSFADKYLSQAVASENAWKNIPQVLAEYIKKYPR